MPSKLEVLPLGALLLLSAERAHAHVSIVSGPAFANVTQVVTFGVGHGCEGADTVSVEVEIPEAASSVRPEPSAFGQADVEMDAAGHVVAVSWTKPDAAWLDQDTQYYELRLRLKPPNAPFTSLYFPAHQTCRVAGGETTVVDWVGLDSDESTDVEPAPRLQVLPARFPGWNKFVVPVAVPDLGEWFADAQIVWRGHSAFSSNPSTAELIAGTASVSVLESLSGGDEVWVKY